MTLTFAPTQQPVNGREYQGNQTQPLEALAMFYRAFNSRDLSLMSRNWDNSEEAALDNPLGGIKRGWQEIRSVYERIFSSPAKVEVEFYDYTLHLNGNIFYVVGRERGTFDANGTSLQLAIRTSRIFRRGDDALWRQIHHHGSFDDPDLLAKYQEAVARK